MYKDVQRFISFFYCSWSGVLVVLPSGCWYRPPIAGIALPLLVSAFRRWYRPPTLETIKLPVIEY